MKNQMTLSFDGAIRYIAGVDEVGRGPLAGPVIAAAVILDPANPVAGLRDSKKLSEKQRNKLEICIKANALAYSYGRSEADEIDDINILQASLLAMSRAIDALTIDPDHVLVDGNRTPDTLYPVTAIIKGDDSEDCIAAASIIAKVKRDDEMKVMHESHPEYGFDRHKGYPTKLHLQALQEHGITKHHRRSFGPVKRLLQDR